MKFMLRHSDKVVGVFVFTAIVALVGALLFAGINKRLFKSDLIYISHFHTAEGLSPGLDLELRGFAIGRIKSLSLNDNNQVEVNFSIFNEYADRMVPGSVIELAVKPLGFGSSLIFYPGSSEGEPLAEGSIIPSSDSPLGRKLLALGKANRPKRQDEMSTLIETLYPLVGQVESIMTTVDRMLIRLDEQLLGPEDGAGTGLLRNVDATLLTANKTVREFGDMAAQLDSTVVQLEAIFQSLAAFAVHLENPDGLIPLLLGDEGSAAQLFQDQGKLFESLSETAEELRLLMVFMNSSTPEISLMMEEATAALIESEKVMQGLQNNPLLRGGIAPVKDNSSTFQGFRQEGQ